MDKHLALSTLAREVRRATKRPEQAYELLRDRLPSIFTAKMGMDGTDCLLRIACETDPGLALWMLARGTAPTPEQCSWCLLRMTLMLGQSVCEALARTLLLRGADVNFTRYDTTPLVVCCYGPGARRIPMMRALLEMPDVWLGVPGSDRGVEEVADRLGNREAAKLIRKARTQQARWGRLRRAWVFAVVRPRPPTK